MVVVIATLCLVAGWQLHRSVHLQVSITPSPSWSSLQPPHLHALHARSCAHPPVCGGVVGGAAVTRLHAPAGNPCCHSAVYIVCMPLCAFVWASSTPCLMSVIIISLLTVTCLMQSCFPTGFLLCDTALLWLCPLQSLDSGPGHRSDDATAGAHAGHESGGGGGSGGAAFLTMVSMCVDVVALAQLHPDVVSM